MNLRNLLDNLDDCISTRANGTKDQIERLRAEIDFAVRFADLFPENREEWLPLIEKATEQATRQVSAAGSGDLGEIVREAESTLAPIGEIARKYTVHCCGHAHIDMNWMWPWQETVNICHDTYTTVDRLMKEFPDFKLSQSQAAIYSAMEEYCPEIFEMIRKRIKEGRWEPTATMWVEGDKNLASGEILCRHMLYTKRFFKEKFGMEYSDLKIDWEPDTFGHAHTLPSILARGGVKRYYHMRTGPNVWLTWWQGPDGSRVLLFLDKAGYNGQINATDMGRNFVDYVGETGLKDYLYVYGVGDHGGGPTRRDLAKAMEIGTWPIFPRVQLSTTDAYFSAVEAVNPELPVFDGELNFVFEGCYTSQSNVKLANRVSENALPEAELIALVSGAAADFPYPSELIRKGWEMAMFNQFHDILPGSGVRATYDYAQGRLQEILAITDSIRNRGLRRLVSCIDTSSPFGIDASGRSGDSLGAGAGFSNIDGVSALNMGAAGAEPIVVFNQLAFPRTGMVEAQLWDKGFAAGQVVVRDDAGNKVEAQVTETGDYWNHKYASVVFPAKDVPAVGYRTFLVERENCMGGPKDDSLTPGTVRMLASGIMENEFIRVEVDTASGAIRHLIEKSTGYDFVPDGGLMGLLEFSMEAPRNMSSWTIGSTRKLVALSDGGFAIDREAESDIPRDGGTYAWSKDELKHDGPHRTSIRIGRKINSSRVFVEIGLNAGSPMADFKISADWREIGNRSEGVPSLRIAFPLRVADPSARYEIPFGSIERPTNGAEVPALRWADLSGVRTEGSGYCGITLLNKSKYGHSADSNVLRLTLIRSSCDPDPVPEVGHHDISFAICPHDGLCSPSSAAKLGISFNQPMLTMSSDLHGGGLPSSAGFVEVRNSNIVLAAIKRAEDSDAMALRFHEMEGTETEASVDLSRLMKPGSVAYEADVLEQPLPQSTVKITNGVLSVRIPPYGISTVIVG